MLIPLMEDMRRRCRWKSCVIFTAVITLLLVLLFHNTRHLIENVAERYMPGECVVNPARMMLCYEQVTYLNPQSPHIEGGPFPYVHLPTPKLDRRIAFYATNDIENFERIIDSILDEKPWWKYRLLQSLVEDRKKSVSSGSVVDKLMDELNPYSHLGLFPQPLTEIQHQISILKQRKFPRKPRPFKCDNCFEYNFKNVISPKDLCTGQSAVKLVVVVTTVPQNTQVRMQLRNTWGSELMKNNMDLGLFSW